MSFLLGTFLQSFQRSAFTVLVRFRDVFFKLIVVLLTSTVIVWLSVFLYAFFYYTYMPAVSHVKPVHLQFRWCDNDSICDFPTANVILAKKGQEQLLMRGQQYKVYLDLEMPESPTNQQLGMFMVFIEFTSKVGNVVHSSSRSAMLRYKSPLHQTLMTLFFTPLLLAGSTEEKQLISLELCDYYEEDPSRPASTVRIEIQNKRIQIYSAQLRIYAHFTGLRYLMFHWPVVSAIVGIGTNLFFLSVVALLSWYRYLVAHESHEVVVRVGFDDNRTSALEKRRTQVKEFLIREKQRQSRMKASFLSFDATTTNTDEKDSISTIGRTHSLDLFPTSKGAMENPSTNRNKLAVLSSPPRLRRQPRTHSESSASRLSPSDMEVIEEVEMSGPSLELKKKQDICDVEGFKCSPSIANMEADDSNFDRVSEDTDVLTMADLEYDPVVGDVAEKSMPPESGIYTSDYSLGPLRRRSFVHQVTL